MEMFNPINIFNGLMEFLETGGFVLKIIMVATLFMWTFIMERFAYYLFAHKPTMARLKAEWDCLLYTSDAADE